MENERVETDDTVKKVPGGCVVTTRTGKKLSKRMSCQKAHVMLAIIEKSMKKRRAGGSGGRRGGKRGGNGRHK